MGLTDLFDPKNAGVSSALSMLVEAGLALYRGEKRLATLLVGAAALAYRWSFVGLVVEALIRFYRGIR